MTIKKTLGIIALASTIGLAGCANNPEYTFNGKIGEEQVKFYEEEFGEYNILKVVKADGSIIRYVDNTKNDLKIEYVEIKVGDNTTQYYLTSKNPIAAGIAQKAQEKFDSYLEKIMEIQTAPLYKE